MWWAHVACIPKGINMAGNLVCNEYTYSMYRLGPSSSPCNMGKTLGHWKLCWHHCPFHSSLSSASISMASLTDWVASLWWWGNIVNLNYYLECVVYPGILFSDHAFADSSALMTSLTLEFSLLCRLHTPWIPMSLQESLLSQTEQKPHTVAYSSNWSLDQTTDRVAERIHVLDVSFLDHDRKRCIGYIPSSVFPKKSDTCDCIGRTRFTSKSITMWRPFLSGWLI